MYIGSSQGQGQGQRQGQGQGKGKGKVYCYCYRVGPHVHDAALASFHPIVLEAQ